MPSKKIIIFIQSYASMNTKLLIDNSIKKFSDIEVLSLPNDTKIDVSSYDIIGFASGIYFWDCGKEIYKHLEKIKGIEGKNVFFICTAGSPKESYIKKPKEAIEKKGGNFVAAFGTMGTTKGKVTGFFRDLFNMQIRPNENDFKECENFIENIINDNYNFICLE